MRSMWNPFEAMSKVGFFADMVLKRSLLSYYSKNASILIWPTDTFEFRSSSDSDYSFLYLLMSHEKREIAGHKIVDLLLLIIYITYLRGIIEIGWFSIFSSHKIFIFFSFENCRGGIWFKEIGVGMKKISRGAIFLCLEHQGT